MPPRILVVDDEALIRWWLSEALSDRGYEVVEAEDGRTALRVLSDGSPPPNVVLLDYRLPDSEDLGLLSKVVSMAPEARVILMTAYTVPNAAEGALARGAFAVLHKPFEILDVTTLVDRPAAARSNA